ncbi:MAG: hypothetical protein ACK52A_08925, partial [Planctomycetota bacterium]
ATNEKTEDKLRTITFLLVTVPFDKTQEPQIPLACENEKVSFSRIQVRWGEGHPDWERTGLPCFLTN